MIHPYSHHTANAIRFKEYVDANSVWCIIGGTAAWIDNDNPPVPAFDVDAVRTPIGAKKGEAVYVSPFESVTGTPDPPGLYTFDGPENTELKFQEVINKAAFIALESRFIILKTELRGAEIPLTTFREIGWFTELVHNQAGSPSILIPTQITNQGRLEGIQYTPQRTRDASSSDFINGLFEF